MWLLGPCLVIASLLLLTHPVSAATSPQTVYRLYNVARRQHLLTLDSHEDETLIQNPVWRNETPTFTALPEALPSVCGTGTVPVHRLLNRYSGEHFLTADANEYAFWTQQHLYDFIDEGIAFCAYSTQVTGSVPVHRLVSYVTGEHFLTADANEVNYLLGHNWYSEGIAFYTTP